MMTAAKIKHKLGASRAQIEYDLPTITARRYFSPLFYWQYQAAVPALRHYIRGKVIDLGCGVMPFRSVIQGQIESYHGLDIFPKSDKITLVGDVQQLGMIPANIYDSAICLEVLEHVPNPWQAAGEICRILKPGGVLVLSVPHLSRLHDLPHDYYRYTHKGLHHLLTQAGFTVVETKTKGGLFTFLGHQLSSVVLSLAWGLPALRPIVWALNKWLLTLGCYWLDQVTGSASTFPLGYVVVARKKGIVDGG